MKEDLFVMVSESLKLCWNSQVVGVISGVHYSDFPWLGGRFEVREIDARLREVLDWYATSADAEELQDPPFSSDLLDGWTVVHPDGSRNELIIPPTIDFAGGYIEWR